MSQTQYDSQSLSALAAPACIARRAAGALRGVGSRCLGRMALIGLEQIPREVSRDTGPTAGRSSPGGTLRTVYNLSSPSRRFRLRP